MTVVQVLPPADAEAVVPVVVAAVEPAREAVVAAGARLEIPLVVRPRGLMGTRDT